MFPKTKHHSKVTWLNFALLLKRAGVAAVDCLSIVAHDKFQEIIDEANRPDSAIRLQQVIIDPTQDLQRVVTVVSQSNIEAQITTSMPSLVASPVSSASPQLIFSNEIERKIAQVTYDIIRRHENLPSSAYLLQEDVQQSMVREVEEALAPVQLEIAGIDERPDIATIVQKTTSRSCTSSVRIIPSPEKSVIYHRFPNRRGNAMVEDLFFHELLLLALLWLCVIL